jgi:hypothetical protein
MKDLILALGLVVLIFTSCTTYLPFKKSYPTPQQDEVIFNRDGFKEYEWKQYHDTVKVKKPRIIGIKGIHNLEYKLNADGIEILKHKYASSFRETNEQGELLFQQALTKVQRRDFVKIMSQLDVEKVYATINTSGPLGEDESQLDILLIKDGERHKLLWKTKYVEDLVKLLSIANSIALEEYKFYQDEAAFIESLKKNTK